MKDIEIIPIQSEDYKNLSCMVGELLNEIKDKINTRAFNFDAEEIENSTRDLIASEKYWVFIAKDIRLNINIGFISLYESFALYSEGPFGTIPELFVRPRWRSADIGEKLLLQAMKFGKSRSWKRLEVTTPPLPEFDRTLQFYQSHGFQIAGGTKLNMVTSQ